MGKLFKAVQDERAEKPFDIPPENKKNPMEQTFFHFYFPEFLLQSQRRIRTQSNIHDEAFCGNS